MIDTKGEFEVLRKLLETLIGADTQKLITGLSDAENEFEKPEVDKDKIGQILEYVINEAKETDEFSRIIDSVEPHVKNLVTWLGPNWIHIHNVLRSKELGKKFPIVIEEYNPLWEERYLEESRFLTSQFGPNIIVRTEHFGSTAVPGLDSKPVIDILVEIISFDIAEQHIIPVLEKQNYRYFWRSDSPPGHMMFVKGYGPNGYFEGVQRYHLHMAPGDHPLWDRLYFRDYLRKYPDAAKRYVEIKHHLAQRYHHDREAYTHGKSEFVREIMGKAKKGLR